jgi:hypothetical protein
MTARYRFLPWVRLGAGSAAADTLDRGLPAHATRRVTLRVNDTREVSVTARLHGPGDVVSLDTRMVVRTDPPHLAAEFEPNYFPLLEFDRPDVPWMFTPATGDAQGRLRPWLVLVAVRKQPGVRLTVDPASRRPVLRLDPPARPADELPDLADSWAWAHAQVVDAGTGRPLDQLLAAESEQNLSRLLCPRRLAPNTAYVACVVPAFDVGRKSGLGLPITADDERALAPAWSLGPGAPVQLSLPVYYHWEFSTGDAGDFETLALRLERRTLAAGVGTRPMTVDGLGFGLPDLGPLALGGALRPVGPVSEAPIPAPFEAALTALLDVPAVRLADGAPPVNDPLVGPPVYGSRHAVAPAIEPGGTSPRPWLAALNLDPRLRAVAGLGALVVQDQQELLMASAWEQLGTAGNETRQVRQPVFAGAVLRRVHAQLAGLEADQLLAVSAPLHGRVRVADPATVGASATAGQPATVTLRQQVRASRTPTSVTSAVFRRAVRPHGPLVRRPAPVGATTTRPLTFVTHVATTTVSVFIRLPRPDMVTPAVLDAQLGRLAVPSLPDRIQQSIRFRSATEEVQDYFGRVAGFQRPLDQRPAVAPSLVRSSLLAQLDPAITVAPAAAPAARAAPAPADPPGVPGAELPGPSFPQPMYEPLRDLDPEYLLPGCAEVPPDSVVPLATNPAFIESYLVGLNHEMSRELLWREHPSDERSTSFRCFWAPAGPDPESGRQIPPLHEWAPDSTLGSHLTSGLAENLVVLVRGELFDRYPGTTVYLTRSTTPGAAGAERVHPLFRGTLGTDMTFVGFAVTAARLATERWFVVFEQQPTEPRFGLDADTVTGRDLDALTAWDDLAWGDLAAGDAELAALTHVPLRGRLDGRSVGRTRWGLNAGHMAAITLQRAFRVALPLADLLPA